jgi:hypothetical protein
MNELRRSLLRLATAQPRGSAFRKRLVAALRRESYEPGETEPDGWNPGEVEPRAPWPEGEGSQMPPERDLKGEQTDQSDYRDNHFAKMAARLAVRFVADSKLDRTIRRRVNADMRRRGL